MDNQKKKVLIVDDDKFLLDMYATKFSKEGFEIDTATGSEDALNKLRNEKKPDIAIFDLIMPQMDGLDLMRTIEKEKLLPNATKVVLTNQGQQSDIDKAKDIGIDGYIVKALHTPSEVVAMIKEIDQKKNHQ